MPYLHVKDFKIGMDRRRERSVGTPGALWLGKNVHITSGGDIEGPKSFVSTYTLPSGTFGMSQVKGQLFVFGSADLSATTPVGVQYQRLQDGGGATMTRVLDVKSFNGKLYVIAEFDDGTIYHFYDGTRVSDWDTVSDANATLAVLTDYLADKINNESGIRAISAGTTILITAATAGTAFTISKATVNGAGGTADQDITLTELQANVAGVTEVIATCTVTVTGGSSNPGLNKISDVTINGVSTLTSAVDWVTSNAVTATALADAITAGELTHGYTAEAVGAVVTISAAAGTGATPNGYAVVATASGTVTLSNTNVSGGVTAVTAVKRVYKAIISGTFGAADKLDKFTLTVDGTAYSATPRGAAAGTSAHVSKKRVWSTAASLLRYCQLTDPSDWTDVNVSSGAGFLAVSSDAAGYERVVCAASYNLQTAVFGRNNISLYTLDTDAQLNVFDQPIENSGTIAARSVAGYGNSEVFYLDLTGIRSLRARSGTNAPYVADVGSPIDPLLKQHLATLSRDQVARAVSIIEPEDGRFWMAVGERIYVLSFFPSAKINAWTYYEPGISITDMVRAQDRLYARAGDVIYLYGGADNATYPEDDEITRRVELPFLAAETPSTIKTNKGFDFDLVNEWEITVCTDPNRQDQEDTISRESTISFGKPHQGIPGEQAAWALNFECSLGGAAKISAFSIHYKGEEAR